MNHVSKKKKKEKPAETRNHDEDRIRSHDKISFP